MKRFAVSFLGVLMIVMAVSGCTGKKPAEQYVSEQLNCSLPAAEKAAGIPKVENGCYYFIDRQHDTERTGLLYRRSYNFSLAIYDLDENILYYCEIDT